MNSTKNGPFLPSSVTPTSGGKNATLKGTTKATASTVNPRILKALKHIDARTAGSSLVDVINAQYPTYKQITKLPTWKKLNKANNVKTEVLRDRGKTEEITRSYSLKFRYFHKALLHLKSSNEVLRAVTVNLNRDESEL